MDGEGYTREGAALAEAASPAERRAAPAATARGRRGYAAAKRAVDILGSLMALVALSPVLLAVPLLILLETRGAPVYSHERLGQGGKKFKLYKFRSMRLDARPLEEVLTAGQLEEYRREFKVDGDPRVTKVGRIIRKTSIDELPQLVNILRGDISIVGPRPIVEEELGNYGSAAGELLSVKPGLTGYWQAYARNGAGYATGKRQEMELHYIRNRGPGFDARIFIKTIASVLKRRGAK
jgi:lipopolysaccharide/colanic/teichoic acid biosynthesis glycosyltransferase